MDEHDLDWAAGLFEGEGTITIGVRKSDRTFRLICTVGNTDFAVIAFFHDRWPGWVQPAYGERPGRRPSRSWTVAGPRAEAFVREIGPYLRTERVRRKADLALEFRAAQSRRKLVWTAPGYKAEQERIYQAMRALNRRGVPIE